MPEPRRALVIEDDEAIRAVIEAVLGDEGWAVREAPGAAAALAILAEWRPDVILLDLMLPGMDAAGFRAAQRDRALALDVPLIVVSASRGTTARAVELGAAAALTKPFDLDELLTTVARVRDGR